MIQFIKLYWRVLCGDIKAVCEFSKKYYDVHDYFKETGGDGDPCHFKTYTCWNCERKFTI